MADYNEWDCPHGVHAGEFGSCSKCSEDRRRKMENPTHQEQIQALESGIQELEFHNRIDQDKIGENRQAINRRKEEISKKRQQLRQLRNANKNA